MKRYLFTVQPEHVGRCVVGIECKCCGHRRAVSLHSAIGIVQRRDVGKRVYLVNGVIQVENDEQRHTRCAHGS